jgi:hypothetical protein
MATRSFSSITSNFHSHSIHVTPQRSIARNLLGRFHRFLAILGRQNEPLFCNVADNPSFRGLARLPITNTKVADAAVRDFGARLH